MTDPAPRTQHLRRIEIRDYQPDDGTSPPVHVGSTFLFDGVPCPPDLIALTEGWEAVGSSVDGTVLSFTVDASKVQLGHFTEPGKVEPFTINGTPVLVPSDHTWELIEGTPDKYLVYVFVREFAFTAAPAEATS